MKKTVVMLLALTASLSLMAGCSNAQEQKQTEAPAQETKAPETTAAPSEASEKPAETEETEAKEAEGGSSSYEIPQGDWVIGLSNSYYGNTWRKEMVDSFTNVAEEAKEKGYIKDYIIQNGDGTVNAQIAQINSFILEGVDAICINAASSTALNSVIDKAVAAGIPVIAFDSTVDNENAYCMDFDNYSFYYKMGDYMAKNCGYKGNVVVVRGVSGSKPEEIMYNAYMKVVEEHPDLKVVATIVGEADATVAQEELTKILPSLDKVDMVFNQGGDTWGIIRAFEQAGMEVPLMSGDNSGEFIKWWVEQENYDTLSMRCAPVCGSAALWTAVNILNGEDVPKKLPLGLSVITRDEADQYTDLEAGQIAGEDWTNDKVMNEIIIPARNK
ncbi:substrate-binding domain-containing protein [Clostridium sp. AM58-1XD]|uniref:substrate-binding domain-containing protein n=1 Tax=Clostridium sp. AM58-1XD TaxID=2292307 RepID=UPI000E4CF26C|nr:substrate-binding domain-containing protein [Clostridium sp. AM58-1XD]RGY99258.1 ABC transporter substrate-binding protein [Clostridium sp. AM58-1XD]